MSDIKKKAINSILIYLIVFTIGGFIIRFFVAAVVSKIYDCSLNTLLNTDIFEIDKDNIIYKASLNVLNYSNLFIYLSMFIGLFFFHFQNLKVLFKDFKDNIIKYLIYIIIFTAILYSSSTLINYFIMNYTDLSTSINQSLIEEMLLNNGYIPIFITTIILAPFVEELIFRKCLNDLIKNKILFCIISSILFGIIHMSTGDGSDILEFILLFLPYFISGIILSLSYISTNNIYINVIIHLLNNLIVYILMLI